MVVAGDWESLETGSRWRLGVAGDWESLETGSRWRLRWEALENGSPTILQPALPFSSYFVHFLSPDTSFHAYSQTPFQAVSGGSHYREVRFHYLQRCEGQCSGT